MNFPEAEQALKDLDEKKQNGQLTAEQYTEEVDKIRVLDAKNTWWQPDPRGTGWLCWDGKDWVSAVPPAPECSAPAAPGIAGSPAQTTASPAPVTAGSPAQATATSPAQGTAGSPAPKSPVEYKFRHVPDTEPGYKLMSLQEFIAIAKIQPWKSRPRKWWDLFSILTGVTLAIIWFVYTCLNPRSEGWDLLTPALMIAVPLFLVCFRKELDNLLMPLQPYREKFPYLFLFGLGICLPFLTAYIMLNWAGIREYSLMHLNVVVGTGLAYTLTREPVLAAGYRGPPRSLKLPLFLFLLLAVVIQIVRADDCMRDPLNGADCLRTSGYGEGMAGAASAAGSAANAGGDAVTTDPGFSDWLNTLVPGEWYTIKGGVEVMVDDDGMVHFRYHGSGSSGTDTGTTGTTPGTSGTDGGTTGSTTGTTGNTTPGTDPQRTSTSTSEGPDGKITTTDTWSNGTTVVTVTDPSTGVKTTTSTTVNGDQTVTTHNPDGTSTTTYPGGRTDRTVTNTDGTQTTTTTYTDKSQSVSTYDPKTGTTTTKNTDGSETVTNRDGTSWNTVTNPDGSKTTTYEDGSTKTVYPGGKTETTGPTKSPGDDSSDESGGFGGTG
jgi:hypothetical protein